MALRYCLLLLLMSLTGCNKDDQWRDIGGEVVSLTELKGQWVLVNYWAIWCKPCIEEIQALNTIDSKRADVTVLGFNYDRLSLFELTRQTERLNIQFQVLQSNPGMALTGKPYLPTVLPTTLVVNPQGELVKTLIGPQTVITLNQHLARLSSKHAP